MAKDISPQSMGPLFSESGAKIGTVEVGSFVQEQRKLFISLV